MAELKDINRLKSETDEDDVLIDMDNQNGDNTTGKPIGLHFTSGGHKIDYVLVYERNPEEEENDDEKAKLAEEHEEKREAFEDVLKEEGLLMEKEMIVSSQVSCRD